MARGIAGVTGLGAAYSSIEENTLLAAVQDGVAQAPVNTKPLTAR